MGLSVARLLASKGANIIIVARNIQTLQEAIDYIKAGALRPSQQFSYISADLTDPREATRVLAEATAPNSSCPPDIVWCCAGSCHPTLFVDTPVSKLAEQMDSNYFTSAYMAHAALNAWLKPSPPTTTPKTTDSTKAPPPSGPSTDSQAQRPKHLIFTSSVLAFYPILGYGPYSPCKSALRALSDTLSQELHLYSSPPCPRIQIHTVFPGTILTAAYAAENRIKPAVTKKLEEDDKGQTPDEVAAESVRALERGEELVTTGWLGWAMYVSALGGSRRRGWGVLDTLGAWVVGVVMVFVRRDMDGKVRRWGEVNGESGGLKE